MNTKAYCRLVHPVIIGLIVAIYSSIGWMEIRLLMHMPVPATWFLTLAVVTPLLCGGLLTGALHEFMHESFFGVLPGARRSVRRWHCGVLAGITVVLGATSLWLAPSMPIASTVGMSSAFLTLPLVNRRSSQSTSRFFMVAGNVVLGIAVFFLFGSRIPSIAVAAPWVVFAAGLLTAGVCIRTGFDPRRVRERSGRVFRSAATGISVMFTEDGRILQAKTFAEAQRRNKQIGRDWLEKSVNTSDRAWLRVLHHEQHGLRRGSAWWVGLIVWVVVFSAMPLGMTLLFERLAEPAASPAQLAAIIATFGRVGASPGHLPTIEILGLFFLMPYWIVLVLALTPQPTPRLFYPLSRHRLAWLNFLLSWRLIGMGFAAQVCSVISTVGFAGFLAGIPFSFENLHVQATIILVQLPLVPVVRIVTLTGRRGYGFTGIVLMMILFVALTIPVVRDWVMPSLSWPAAVVSLIATGLALWIYWRRLLRHYTISDLNQPTGLFQAPAAP